MVFIFSLGGFVADQMRYNLESAHERAFILLNIY